CRNIQLIERGHDRQTADELRNEIILDQILGLDVMEQVAAVRAHIDVAYFGRETNSALLSAVENDLLEPGERTTADKEDVARVDLQELLLRVLAPALRRNGGDSA